MFRKLLRICIVAVLAPLALICWGVAFAGVTIGEILEGGETNV